MPLTRHVLRLEQALSRRQLARAFSLAVVSCSLLLPTGCLRSRSKVEPAVAEPTPYVTTPPSLQPVAMTAYAAPVAQPPPEPQLGAGTGDAQLRERYRDRRPLKVLNGKSAYYHDSLAGNRTASGERYDPKAFTAAHRSLPFGTVVRVSRSSGGPDVYVRINDRGPFTRGRILDLSRAAAEQVGLIRAGVAEVRLEILEYGPKRPAPKGGDTRRK